MDGLNYNPFVVQRPQQQQQQQVSPQNIMQGMDIAKQFGAFGGAGGGAGVATGSQAAGNVAAAQGIGSAGTIGGGGWGAAGGASGAGGMGSAMSAAGPWAALAAIIYANESYAQERGYRPESKTEYAKSLASADVFAEDLENRWLPKLGIDEDSKANKILTGLGSFGTIADPGKAFERIKDIF